MGKIDKNKALIESMKHELLEYIAQKVFRSINNAKIAKKKWKECYSPNECLFFFVKVGIKIQTSTSAHFSSKIVNIHAYSKKHKLSCLEPPHPGEIAYFVA